MATKEKKEEKKKAIEMLVTAKLKSSKGLDCQS